MGVRVVGDFLIESECEAGHTGSITIHGHASDVARAIARMLDERCRWPHGDDECGRRVANVVTDLGPPESARRGPATPPVRKTTKPSMQAVIVPSSLPSLSKRPAVEIVENDGLEIRGDESTEPPPPTTEGTGGTDG